MADEDMMDSLFEGMVLFNPSQIQQDPTTTTPDDPEQHDRTTDNDSLNQSSQIDSPAPSSSSTIIASSSSLSSLPLDENLFSDLTLVTPLHNSEVAETENLPLQSQSHSLSRQLSVDSNSPSVATSTNTTRRKKRAGIRIGYGRDTLLSNDIPEQHPLPISISSSVASETLEVSQNDVPSSVEDSLPLHPQTITSDTVVTTPESESVQSSSLNDDTTKSEIKESLTRKDDEEVEIREGNRDDDSFSEAEFEQIKDRIYEKLNRARQLVASVSAVRKDSIKNRRKAVQNANLASLKHMELEKQLEEACEAEDFEMAERVSQDLFAAEKEKQASMNSLREADALIDSVDVKMQQALESQIAAEEECAILLEQFAKVSSKNLGCKFICFSLECCFIILLVHYIQNIYPQ